MLSKQMCHISGWSDISYSKSLLMSKLIPFYKDGKDYLKNEWNLGTISSFMQ